MKTHLHRRGIVAALTVAALSFTAPALAQDKSIVVSSTTSTQDSGLFGHILPLFKAKTGIDVKVISQGTCLLYTSPSPRDRTRSRMPSSA